MDKNSHNITLAEFVRGKRENAGFSASGLAQKSNLSLDLIEKIEANEELFLSTTARQNLAKALKCSPQELKKLEKTFDTHFASEELIEKYKEQILNGEENLICPKCGSTLICTVDTMFDLEDNEVFIPKAHCQKCPFLIK